jgi:hypothetical protein
MHFEEYTSYDSTADQFGYQCDDVIIHSDGTFEEHLQSILQAPEQRQANNQPREK